MGFLSHFLAGLIGSVGVVLDVCAQWVGTGGCSGLEFGCEVAIVFPFADFLVLN